MDGGHERVGLGDAVPVRHPRAPVDRPNVRETTALGAAWLAGMQAGVYPGRDEFAATWALERRFSPAMDETTRAAKYARWRRAVDATIGV